jgi:CYTH domain-containing protein
MKTPKYTLPEIERRWLLDEPHVPHLDQLRYVDVEDRYIDNSRLRLRKMIKSDGATVYKLCKKYGKTQPITEPITNIYLTKSEYELLLTIPAKILNKRKYLMEISARTFSISRMIVPGTGQVIYMAETEFSTIEEAKRAQVPEYFDQEVSDDENYESVRFAI